MTLWPAGWKPDAIVAVPLAISLLLYLAGLVRVYVHSGRRLPIRRWEIASFTSGWVALVVALPIFSSSCCC